jgi:hypothetical protein
MTNHARQDADADKRRKALKKARYLIWLSPLGLNACVAGLVWGLHRWLDHPQMESALSLVAPLGGIFYFTGQVQQAWQTLRSQGVEKDSLCVKIGSRFAVASFVLPSLYTTHWIFFYSLVALLVLGALCACGESWNVARERRALADPAHP